MPKITSQAKAGKQARPSTPTSSLAQSLSNVDLTQKRKSGKEPLNHAPTQHLSVFLFGSGEGGELGFGASGKLEARVPKRNPQLDDIVQIATGGMHCIALTDDNQVLTWGVNDKKALGRDTTYAGRLEDDSDDEDEDAADLNPLEATPTAISMDHFPVDTVVVQVSAGDSSSFALTADGYVYGWGIFRDAKGDFGFTLLAGTPSSQKPTEEPQPGPKLIQGLSKIIQIAAGGDHLLALDKLGQVWAFGAGEQAQTGRILGSKRYPHLILRTQRLALPKTIVSISAAANHSFAITKDGEVWSWGLNQYGQCGIPRTAGSEYAIIPKPEKVEDMPGPMAMVVGGNHHSIGITRSGNCYTWGRLDSCATGHSIGSLDVDDDELVLKSDDTHRPIALLQPLKLSNLKDIRYVAAGSDHCIAVTGKGKVYSWGFNASSQLGQGKDPVRGTEDDPEDDADDIDEIVKPTLIKSKALAGKKVIWAGCGGQFSVVAATM